MHLTINTWSTKDDCGIRATGTPLLYTHTLSVCRGFLPVVLSSLSALSMEMVAKDCLNNCRRVYAPSQ